jgi:hypothetical protein
MCWTDLASVCYPAIIVPLFHRCTALLLPSALFAFDYTSLVEHRFSIETITNDTPPLPDNGHVPLADRFGRVPVRGHRTRAIHNTDDRVRHEYLSHVRRSYASLDDAHRLDDTHLGSIGRTLPLSTSHLRMNCTGMRCFNCGL